MRPLWQDFDPVWYAACHPDAAAAGDDQARLEHFYWEHGCRRGDSPNRAFDERWYLSAYPDIAAHVAAGGARSGFEHYAFQGGHADRAAHWLFDEAYYRQHNRVDLSPPGIRNGYGHFLLLGDRDDRTGHQFFDPAVARDHGLRAADPDAGLFAALLHDPAAGDSRLSWYFDPAWYLAAYPAVREAIAAGHWNSALHHYLANPEPTRFEPNPFFSEQYYAAEYADVRDALASGNFRNGYTHFLRHGAAERRRPHPDVDLERHFARPGTRLAMQRGGFADSFAHFVAAADAATDAVPFPAEAQCKRAWIRQAEIAVSQFARRPLDFRGDAPPELAVVMVVHDRFALTLAALASLRAGCPGAIEVLLVDSGSRDETRAIERYALGLTVIRFERNLGFVEGCNAALARATAPVVLYLNNDLSLGFNAIPAALARLRSDPAIGAVGGRIVRTNGELQEAGCIVWRDGYTAGYLRGADPDLPEANFVRDVDFCSGAFLMAPRDLLAELGGFDPAFRPAYHEEVDLCVRMRRIGRRVVYDPAVLVQHLEFGSSSPARSGQLIRRNHRIFVEKHREWLRFQYPRSARSAVFARSPRGDAPRVLFFEDRIPSRRLGSGFVRSNDIVRAMADLGCEVGVFPVYPHAAEPAELLPDFPDIVELFHDRGLERLPEFLSERAGYYDLVWIGRTHNLGRLLPVLEASAAALPDHGFILDTEAVAAPR
ncbi:MAG: glycosyltransferase, partial [Gluconacetobacter diazotrophicus]|nr:glycosyltransferase [Gluconacetobacter diazotrophicus]